MSDVLICCTDAEGSQLQWLAKALLDSGWSVDFMHKGSSGVASAQCVIAVWSPHSVGDAWLNARAKTAAKRRRLVSIRLGGARPPRGLRSEQVIDLSEWPARGADRAINSLLGSVDAIAHGTISRVDDEGFSSMWIAAIAVSVLAAGGYVLYRIAATPNGEHSYSTSASERGERDSSGAATVSSDPPTGVSDRGGNDDADGTRTLPRAVASDASRLGAQALDRVSALIGGGAEPIADVRRATDDALALDANEPHARAANALLRGFVDLQWNAAARELAALPAEPADPALADIVARYRALFGVAAVPSSMPNEVPDAVSDAASSDAARLCGSATIEQFAKRFGAMDGVERLRVLDSRCAIERLHDDAALRRAIGIAT